MNALLPVFLVLVLFGGEKTKSVTELLSRIDFASFRPVFNLLGVNDESKNSSSAEVANKLSPIENVVPSEIENSLTSYFG